MVVGAKRDPSVGPVVMIGDGGKYVEALKDSILLVPPFSAEEAVEAMTGLRIWAILQVRAASRPWMSRRLPDLRWFWRNDAIGAAH